MTQLLYTCCWASRAACPVARRTHRPPQPARRSRRSRCACRWAARAACSTAFSVASAFSFASARCSSHDSACSSNELQLLVDGRLHVHCCKVGSLFGRLSVHVRKSAPLDPCKLSCTNDVRQTFFPAGGLDDAVEGADDGGRLRPLCLPCQTHLLCLRLAPRPCCQCPLLSRPLRVLQGQASSAAAASVLHASCSPLCACDPDFYSWAGSCRAVSL